MTVCEERPRRREPCFCSSTVVRGRGFLFFLAVLEIFFCVFAVQGNMHSSPSLGRLCGYILHLDLLCRHQTPFKQHRDYRSIEQPPSCPTKAHIHPFFLQRKRYAPKLFWFEFHHTPVPINHEPQRRELTTPIAQNLFLQPGDSLQ